VSIDLEALYIDLHRHPELSFQETRTAGVTRELAASVSTTPRASARPASPPSSATATARRVAARRHGRPARRGADGSAYASTARGIDPAGTDVPVMHACGHDMHVTAMLGALERLVATKDEWSGTVVAVFQPAEEYGAGAQAMIADGVLDRLPEARHRARPAPDAAPAGVVGVRPGTQMAASDGITVRLLGRGGHGSRPHATIDPIVMAAATVMRLQTIVSREIDPREMAVVTVGAIHAG
jgi:hippurate hydrolase